MRKPVEVRQRIYNRKGDSMKSRKLIALLLAAVMLIGTMTGCNQSTTTQAEVQNEAEKTTEENTETGVKKVKNLVIGTTTPNEKLKSALEGKAEHLADKLVPYSLGGTALTYLLTRNVNKAISVLMVDFSCALKLAMPISVLSAIRDC